MTPYLLLLLFVTLNAYLGRRSGHKLIRRMSLLIIGMALILFAGLRDYRVGTDTGNYIRHFYASDSFDYVTEQQDVGYYLISWLARSMTDSYASLLLLIALLVVSCYLITIIRVVKRYETAVYLFVALGVYTFFFNGARQGLAAAICFYAIPYLLQRRMWPYIALVIVATAFHRTALIALPLYWAASPHVNWRRLMVLAGATLVLIAFLSVFVSLAAGLLSDKFEAYAEVGEGGGEIWVAFLLGQGALLYYFKRIVSDPDGWYGRLLSIYLIGLVPALASTLSGVNPSGVLRLHLYFSSTAILLWPMVFQGVRPMALRGMLSLGFLVLTIGLFVLTTTTFSNLTPYRINSELFPS